jgi:ferredoxin-NADP reductase
MLTTLQSSTQLYFSVAKRDDLFYVDEIRSLKHVESHIHLTREAGEGFSHGRIDVRSIEATNDTEWYLCGNPSLIKESKHILQHRGFTKIYTEEF